MSMMFIKLLSTGLALPAYVLGQPLEDARRVIPNGQTAETWHLLCAGDPDAPEELQVSPAEKGAGVQRCWPFEIVSGEMRRSAHPRGSAVSSSEEIEFLNGRIVRIKMEYKYEGSVVAQRITRSTPDADILDNLNERRSPQRHATVKFLNR